MTILAHDPTGLPIVEQFVDLPPEIEGFGELGPSKLDVERAKTVDVGDHTRVVFRVRLTPLDETIARGGVTVELDRGALLTVLGRA